LAAAAGSACGSGRPLTLRTSNLRSSKLGRLTLRSY